MTKEDLATSSHQLQSPARNPDGAGSSTTQAHVSLAPNVNTFTNAGSVVASIRQSGAGMGHPINSYTITTPLRPLQFERELHGHPDKLFVAQLLQDLTNGCDVGYKGPRFQCVAPHLPSAYIYSDVIDKSITQECTAGRLAGPFANPPFKNIRCSGLGVVPKRDGGWRIIYDLSSPTGTSVNDFIDPNAFSLTYCTIDDAAKMVLTAGQCCLMGKIDLKHAFRNVPVRPTDWELLGILWKGKYYVDTCLPFGLRSAPFLFNRVSEAIEWSLKYNHDVHDVIHYLDDFFTVGKSGTNICEQNMKKMVALCKQLGAPLKEEKIEGPTTCITFLGIELDSTSMVARLPADRKLELQDTLLMIRARKKCTKRELLSLIGRLAFACRVVPAGRMFMRRMIDLSCTVKRLNHRIWITVDAKRDLDWWIDFLPQWSGSSQLLDPHWCTSPGMELYTDACSFAYAAYWRGKWVQQRFQGSALDQDIAWKELYAIVVACNVWGPQWKGKKILFHCDNEAIVHIWKHGSSKSKSIMTLLRATYWVAAHYQFNIMITHIRGCDNIIADSLSRFQMDRFRETAPGAEPLPTPTPAKLMRL